MPSSSYKTPEPLSCGCLPGARRCTRHSVDYAVRQMQKKGWAPWTKEEHPQLDAKLKELGIKTMEWWIKYEENNNLPAAGRPIKGNWSPAIPLLVAQSSLDWEARKWFLLQLEKAPEPGYAALHEVIKSANRLGGIDAVSELLEEQLANIGREALKSMGGKTFNLK